MTRNSKTREYLRDIAGISEAILDLTDEAERELFGKFKELDDIKAFNQYKVLRAMQENHLSDMHFTWATGYGYDDAGRDAVERIYADVFGAEAALIRPTHPNQQYKQHDLHKL